MSLRNNATLKNIGPAENVVTAQVFWPVFEAPVEPAVPQEPDPAFLEELGETKNALAAALEELRLAKERIGALEGSIPEAEAAAYQRGHSEGEQAANEQSAKEKEALLERISRAVADMAVLRGRLRREAEGDLVKLALVIARRITHREINADPEALLGVVHSALTKVPAKELTRISLHPSIADTVRSQIQGLRIPSSVEIVADPSLQPGDLQLETLNGLLDASVDTQLKEIELGLIDRLEH